MISGSDFLLLPYTADLTHGGITYALRSLPYSFEHRDGTPYARLRRTVASVAVELAFRRYLDEHNIPFDVRAAMPFTDRDRYDVRLGGHRCEIRSFLLTRRAQITQLRDDAGIVLRAPALVPADHDAADGHLENDLYLFAFVSGLIAASHDDMMKALRAGQSVYLLHEMPNSWRKPTAWHPLGPLALKSESDAPLQIEFHGQDESRAFLTKAVELPPRTRLEVEEPYFSLSSIHAKSLPAGRLGVHSPTRRETHMIAPFEWGNLWVDGMDIIFAGYISREEFRQRARLIQPDSRVFQFDRTKTKNLAVPVSDLRPLSRLFERVKAWETSRAR